MSAGQKLKATGFLFRGPGGGWLYVEREHQAQGKCSACYAEGPVSVLLLRVRGGARLGWSGSLCPSCREDVSHSLARIQRRFEAAFPGRAEASKPMRGKRLGEIIKAIRAEVKP